jgi:hypothetical protein|tara:strand:+ start:6802 stop:8526 length:1725 start_codon:yes stop_codon:yes gene_type:complete
MAEKVTIEVEADIKGAIDSIGKIEEGVKDIGQTAKKQKGAIEGLAKGFRGVGLAMKAIGIGIVLKLVDQLGQAMMKNQEIADTVSTAFNMVGLVFNKIIRTVKTVFDRITGLTDNFDALGRIMSNLMTLAITPLKLAFNSVALVIKEVQLAWEKSWLGKGDQQRIAELTAQITGYKEEIRIAGEEAIKAGQGIIVDFREGINEITNMGKVVVEEFNNTFKGVTVSSLKDQAEAITQATNNLSLLEAKHEKIIKEFEIQAEVQRKIRDDVSNSIQDRIKANDKLLEISKEQADAEIKALKEQQGALSAQLAIEVDNVEIKAQIERLNNAILETEFRKTQLEKESGEQKNALLAEERANKQELAKIGVDEVERQKKEFENERDRLVKMAELTISNEEERNAKILQIKEEFNAKINKIDADEKDKQDAIDKQELADKIALEDAKRQAIQSGLSGIGALVGESSKAGKAIAVANATIDTFAGANKAIAQGGIVGIASAVGIIATGLANVRSILQTDIPGESGGGTAPATPEVVDNTVPVAPTFGAITADAPPVQAFVVESDVSSSQALQNDLNLQATL